MLTTSSKGHPTLAQVVPSTNAIEQYSMRSWQDSKHRYSTHFMHFWVSAAVIAGTNAQVCSLKSSSSSAKSKRLLYSSPVESGERLVITCSEQDTKIQIQPCFWDHYSQSCRHWARSWSACSNREFKIAVYRANIKPLRHNTHAIHPRFMLPLPFVTHVCTCRPLSTRLNFPQQFSCNSRLHVW